MVLVEKSSMLFRKTKFPCVALLCVLFAFGCGRPKPSDTSSVLASAVSLQGAKVIADQVESGADVVLLHKKVLSGVDPFEDLLRVEIKKHLKKAGITVVDQMILDPSGFSFIRSSGAGSSDKGIKEDAYNDLVNEFSDIDAFVSFAGPVHPEDEGGVDVPLIVMMPYGMPHVGRMEESLMNGEALMWIVRHPAWPDVMSVADLSPEEQFNKLFMVVTKDTLDAYFDALDAE